jgi:hypothetical protein
LACRAFETCDSRTFFWDFVSRALSEAVVLEPLTTRSFADAPGTMEAGTAKAKRKTASATNLDLFWKEFMSALISS